MVQATLAGKSATTQVTVVDQPVIERINFQVKDTPPRAGWKAENGQRFSESRGYGWLGTDGLATRDDRHGVKNFLLKSFVVAKEKQFRLQVPQGMYEVRIAMGDADYGSNPFESWTSLGDEKFIYYQGHANNMETRIVPATDEGLVFTVNGPINYIIAAPVGIALAKYADDGPADGEK